MNPKRIAILAVLAAVLMLGFCSRCVSHESGSKSGKRMREGEPSAYLQGEIGRQFFPMIIDRFCPTS